MARAMSSLFSESSLESLEKRSQWHGDVFGDVKKSLARVNMFHPSRLVTDWIYLFSAVVLMFLVDTFILRRFTVDCTWKTHIVILTFWVLVAGIFALFIDITHGRDLCVQWTSGYLLEWLLSMDNLFVFHLIFKAFATPEPQIHKALFFGILGAVLFRMGFFMVLHALLNMHKWIHYVFGAILIYSGVQAATDDDDEDDPTKSTMVCLLKRCLGSRLHENYSPNGSLFLTDKNGLMCATLLVPVIICLEVWDIVFAIDSVSAKVAQIPDQFMNYSSSIFAMFGLRAMFFIIHDLVQYFELLKYGLCFILVFIGLELMFEDYVQLPASTVLILIITVFAVCCAGSALKSAVNKDKDADNETGPVPHTDHA